MAKKVFILGPAGIGKTTLAEFISKRYRIPFIQGSSKTLWEKYGIKSHLELLKLEGDVLNKFQNELLDLRVSSTMYKEDFVSDRSIMDNAVYYLLQNAHNSNKQQVEDYITRCAIEIDQQINDGAKFLYLSSPKDGYPLEDDNMRINHLYYQDWVVGSMFDRLIKDKLITKKLNHNNFIVIDFWDWEDRVRLVETFLDLSSWEKFLIKVKNFIM